MVFGPTPMRRLYLAVPIEYEDQVLTAMGEMGTVHLISEFQVKRAEKSRIIDINTRLERLNERLDAILAEEASVKLAQTKVEGLAPKNFEEAEGLLTKAETELNDFVSELERSEKEIKELTALKDMLYCLVLNGLRTDEVGVFRHVFVKGGFLRSSLTGKLNSFLGGTSVVSVPLTGRPRENFVLVAGLNEDRSFTEQALKVLNFEELAFPSGLAADPKVASGEIEKTIKLKENQIGKTREKMMALKASLGSLSPYVSEAMRYEEAKELVVRTQKRSIFHGWVPRDKIDALKVRVEQVVPKESIYFRVEEPRKEDTVPVEFRSGRVIRAFEIFTNLQGVPGYFEINPTPIYTLLYVIMFGMMFGDIGGGIVLMILGLLITRMRRGLFAFSLSATKKIAVILILCGVMTVIFGFFYGVFFLVKTPWPYLLSPLNNFEEILVIALAFGVAQIILSLTLNVINMIRRDEHLKAMLGDRGIIALVFYVSGVVVAYAFIRERNLGVFFSGYTTVFSSIALASLFLIFFSPLLGSVLGREKTPIGQKLLEGFGQGLESFIAFIANSVSYIRLAAFAIAHEAIAVAAVVLGSVFGSVLSLLLLNMLDFVVEGFASFIQSLRLMYYEFSTRFFLKNGIAYQPFKIGPIRMKI